MVTSKANITAGLLSGDMLEDAGGFTAVSACPLHQCYSKVEVVVAQALAHHQTTWDHCPHRCPPASAQEHRGERRQLASCQSTHTPSLHQSTTLQE
jgi:hypothetical protein